MSDNISFNIPALCENRVKLAYSPGGHLAAKCNCAVRADDIAQYLPDFSGLQERQVCS